MRDTPNSNLKTTLPATVWGMRLLGVLSVRNGCRWTVEVNRDPLERWSADRSDCR